MPSAKFQQWNLATVNAEDAKSSESSEMQRRMFGTATQSKHMATLVSLVYGKPGGILRDAAGIFFTATATDSHLDQVMMECVANSQAKLQTPSTFEW